MSGSTGVLLDSSACASPPRARQRDIAFGAGCGLLCFGLFPFSAPSSGYGHDIASDFDSTTRSLSATFAVTGFVCLVLSCVDMSRSKLRTALGLVFVPLAVAVVASCANILHATRANDVVSVLRHSRVLSFDQELRIESAVNDLYCNALARKQCDGDGSEVLGLGTRREIDATCAHAYDHCGDSFGLDSLSLIENPTVEAVDWCGQYVVSLSHEGAVDLTKSPYHQHYEEVLDGLFQARNRRRTCTKLLMVLEWFAVPALVAIVWWLHALSAKQQATVHAIV